jgi:hypothetical protein
MDVAITVPANRKREVIYCSSGSSDDSDDGSFRLGPELVKLALANRGRFQEDEDAGGSHSMPHGLAGKRLSKRSILFLLPGLDFLLLLVVMLGLLVLHVLGLMVQLAARLLKRSIILLQPCLFFGYH